MTENLSKFNAEQVGFERRQAAVNNDDDDQEVEGVQNEPAMHSKVFDCKGREQSRFWGVEPLVRNLRCERAAFIDFLQSVWSW